MWFRRKRVPNYAEHMAELYRSAPFGSEDDSDLMRDFRQVFLSTPQGKRVLYSIVAWGGLYDADLRPTDGEELNRAEGRAELARSVMRATFAEVAEPKEIRSDDD